MKGIQHALSNVSDSADLAALESLVDTAIANANAGMEEYHQIQDQMSRVIELAASCEALEKAGQFNRASAIVLMSSLEAMGHDFGEVAGLESLDDAGLTNVAMEGLGDVLRKVGNRLREWWQNRKYAAQENTGNIRKMGENAIKEIAAVRAKLESVGNERRTYSISSIANALRVGDSQPDPNATAAWVANAITHSKNNLAAGQRMAKASEDLFNSADLSSDAAYEKTALKKLPAILNLWLKTPPYKGLPEGVSVSIGELPAESKAQILKGDGHKVKGRGGAIVWTREGKKPNKGPEQHASKSDALKWLDAAEKYFEDLNKGNFILTCNTAYEEYYNSQVKLYLAEAGEVRQSRLVNNLDKYTLKPGTFQAATVPGWSYFEEGLFYAWWNGAVAARALITAARRVAVEGK